MPAVQVHQLRGVCLLPPNAAVNVQSNTLDIVMVEPARSVLKSREVERQDALSSNGPAVRHRRGRPFLVAFDDNYNGGCGAPLYDVLMTGRSEPCGDKGSPMMYWPVAARRLLEPPKRGPRLFSSESELQSFHDSLAKGVDLPVPKKHKRCAFMQPTCDGVDAGIAIPIGTALFDYLRGQGFECDALSDCRNNADAGQDLIPKLRPYRYVIVAHWERGPGDLSELAMHAALAGAIPIYLRLGPAEELPRDLLENLLEPDRMLHVALERKTLAKYRAQHCCFEEGAPERRIEAAQSLFSNDFSTLYRQLLSLEENTQLQVQREPSAADVCGFCGVARQGATAMMAKQCLSKT
eukprot:gene14569-17218_t